MHHRQNKPLGKTGTVTVTITVQDSGGTSNGGKNTFTTSFTVSVVHLNVAPTLDLIPDLTISEDTSLWIVDLTGIGAGTAEESLQHLGITAISSRPDIIRELIVNYISPNTIGTLRIRPVPAASGTTIITVILQDDGGTVAGGANMISRTFILTLLSVNHAPTFMKGTDQLVFEGSGAQTVAGWATGMGAGPPNESGQTLNFLVSADQPSLFSVQPSLAADGTLTFTLAANAFGTAIVTVRLHDSGGTANGGVDTSLPQTFTITIQPVNDPPTLNVIGNQSINEDSDWVAVPLSGIGAGPPQ